MTASTALTLRRAGKKTIVGKTSRPATRPAMPAGRGNNVILRGLCEINVSLCKIADIPISTPFPL